MCSSQSLSLSLPQSLSLNSRRKAACFAQRSIARLLAKGFVEGFAKGSAKGFAEGVTVTNQLAPQICHF